MMGVATQPLEKRKLTVTGEVFGTQYADCELCELSDQCAKGKFVLSEMGKKYQPGGLMILGEGPGVTEVSHRRPFVGQSGRLLNALLEAAAIDREACYVSNATLCLPPQAAQLVKGGLMERAPNAVYACLPRLEAEISAARPRVILAAGAAALAALTGYEVERTRQVKIDCDNALCDPKTRKLQYKGLGCALGDCGWFHLFWDEAAQDEEAAALKERLEGKCPRCGSSIARLRPRAIKCPSCGGRKTRIEEYTTFVYEHKLIGRYGVAGAVIDTTTVSSRLDQFGVKYIVATYHPSFCLRAIGKASGGKSKIIGGQYAAHASLMHIEKAGALLKRDARFSVKTISTADPQVVDKYLAEPGTYACDIETDSFDGPYAVTKITCVGFARADREEALVVDTRGIRGWDVPSALLDVLHRAFIDPDKGMVFHNGIYDRMVIRRIWGVDVENVVGDTLIAHNATWPDEEHGLGFVAHELLDMPPWKDTAKIPPGETDELSGYSTFEELANYNAHDTRATALVDETLCGADGEHGYLATEGRRAAYDMDLNMADVAIEMQWGGMFVNEKIKAEIRGEAEEKRARALAEMRKLISVGDSWSPTGKDLLWAMYDPTGPLMLVAPAATPKGQPSTAKEHLAKMREVPFIHQLLEYRKHDYHLSHYINSPLVQPGPDGRIHPSWKPWGARTGRWTSEPNCQNWPKYMRRCFTAPPGRAFVGADYDQLELRILAALSGDEEMIRRCAEADSSDKLHPDKDPHSYIAHMTFGQTYLDLYRAGMAGDEEALTKCKALRDVTKRTVYGLNYGSGAETVLNAIYDGGYEGPPLNLALIKRVIETYFTAYRGVRRWREDTLRKAQKEHALYSPILGRHRVFPLGDIDTTVAYNFGIQCVVAGTRVLTSDGYVPIEDAPKTLTASIGSPGQWVDGTLRLDKSAEEVWRTTLDNGQVLETNEEHYLQVLREGEHDFSWRAVGELRKGDHVACPLAAPLAFGRAAPEQLSGLRVEDAYWLGYYIGNGSWDARDTLRVCFGNRVGRFSHETYAGEFAAWAARFGGLRRPDVYPNMTVHTVMRNSTLYDAMAAWGAEPQIGAHRKRVPELVWRASLEHRKAFLLGLLDADGTLANSPPALHMCNDALLREVQLLLRTVGVVSRLRGPYVADRHGHQSWRLAMNGSLLRAQLGYGGTPERLRFERDAVLAPAAVERFLAAVPSNPFSFATEQSFHVLYHRLRNGGTTNPHTLARMEAAVFGPSVQDVYLYTTSGVRSVERLGCEASMHTLAVPHEVHRYDSAGVISKNSGAADIVNLRTWEFFKALPAVDPTAHIFAQVHDAVYVECDKTRAPAVAKLLEQTLTVRWALVPGTSRMPFTASAQISDNWKEAA